MESLFPGLISAILSGLIVGGVMLAFQTKMSKAVEDAKDANQLRFRNVTDKFENLSKKTDLMTVKIDHLDEKVNSMTAKVSVVVTEQKHLAENLSSLKDEVRVGNARIEKFGRVVVKP